MSQLIAGSARALMLLAALVVTGCVTRPPQTATFRAADAPIWSAAQLDLSRLPGRWRQVGDFAQEPTRCRPGGAEISGPPAGLRLAARLCQAGADRRIAGPMQPAGPGRFTIGDQVWWVLWADADYRTLVIGAPSGTFGLILNRDGALPPDRQAAVREILDFNGYDLSRLRLY